MHGLQDQREHRNSVWRSATGLDATTREWQRNHRKPRSSAPTTKMVQQIMTQINLVWRRPTWSFVRNSISEDREATYSSIVEKRSPKRKPYEEMLRWQVLAKPTREMAMMSVSMMINGHCRNPILPVLSVKRFPGKGFARMGSAAARALRWDWDTWWSDETVRR